jgi:large subunit ribosomal protein L10
LPSNKVLLEKQKVVEELKAKIDGSVAGVLVDYKGINVADDTKLRKEMREAGVHYSVYKNSAIRFAVTGGKFEELAKHLDGTTAVALSETDATVAARIIAKYAKENKDCFNIKGGFIENDVLDAAGVDAIASIPSREVLLSQLAGGLNGIIRNLAVVLDQVAKKDAPAEEASA